MFKFIALCFLAYLCYRLGKASVAEPVANEAQTISKSIRRLEKDRGDIPKQLAEISSKYKKLIMLSLVGALLFYGFAYKQNVHVSAAFWAVALIIPITLYLVMSVKKSMLSKKQSKWPREEEKIRNQTRTIMKKLGNKVENSLRSILCR